MILTKFVVYFRGLVFVYGETFANFYHFDNIILLHNSKSLNSSIVIACATSSNANYSRSTHTRGQIDGLKLV